MPLTIQPVRSDGALHEFARFPWTIYRDDPCWVPPLYEDRLSKLDPQRNPFWKNARRELWLAELDGRPAGTIAAIVDQDRIHALGQPVGVFGFFECIPNARVARALFETADAWLSQQGMRRVIGPYSPGNEDEAGILVEGFNTRPALLEAHTPRYYPDLVEGNGYTRFRDLVARLYARDFSRTLEDQVPEKLVRVAQRAAQRSDLRIREINMRRWDQEIELAWRIYNAALSSLPDNVPTTLLAFRQMADAFRSILDPRLALIAEVGGRPVGYALALPDMNEVLQKVLSRSRPVRLGPWQMARLLWHSRKVSRVSFKILMMLPEYQGRGVEAVLTYSIGRAIWERGYREVDMSLTGEENEKSNRFQSNLGFQVYRRYFIYQKELA